MHPFQPNFEDFKDQCVKNMMSLQSEFMKLYDIDSYEEWFCDHGIGAFHFQSGDGRNLYFKYVKVGTFSTNTNTWNWSWANKMTPTHVSQALEKVKLWGATHNFELLTKGLFEGDEYTGWEMTSISAALLNVMGAYRISDEHLFHYFIFTNELTQEEYSERKDKYIACDLHTSGRVAFVCQHLNSDTYTGFHEAFDPDTITDDDDGYQAWCNECEKVRLKEDGWNDTSMAFAKIKAVCDQCYFEIKKRNKLG